MLTAITRDVSSAINRCELTFLERDDIDVDRARNEHRAYERCLEAFGAKVISLPSDPALPDCVFVEDCAIVLDEIAVMTRPGAVSRRGELPAITAALTPFRALRKIMEPGSLEGGDVLRVGRTLFVGVSMRTNLGGISQLEKHVGEFGYTVRPVTVLGCLHLKSAVCSLGHELLLANRQWIDMKPFAKLDVLDVASTEPTAANVLEFGDTVLMPKGFPETADRVRARGRTVQTVDIGELRKAEAGLTCSSLLFQTY